MFWKGLLVRTDGGRSPGEYPRREEVTVHAAFTSGDPALFSLDSEFVQGYPNLDRGVLAKLIGVLVADHGRRHVFAFVFTEGFYGPVRFCEDRFQLVYSGNFLFMLAIPVLERCTLQATDGMTADRSFGGSALPAPTAAWCQNFRACPDRSR